MDVCRDGRTSLEKLIPRAARRADACELLPFTGPASAPLLSARPAKQLFPSNFRRGMYPPTASFRISLGNKHEGGEKEFQSSPFEPLARSLARSLASFLPSFRGNAKYWPFQRSVLDRKLPGSVPETRQVCATPSTPARINCVDDARAVGRWKNRALCVRASESSTPRNLMF